MKTPVLVKTSDIVTLQAARPALRAMRRSGANSFRRALAIMSSINRAGVVARAQAKASR